MYEDLFCKEKFSNLGINPSLRCETVTYVFDWQPGKKKLEDIRDVLYEASGKFVKIKFIDTGKSIIVTCSFPHFLIGALIINLMENLEMLKKNKLKKLIVGYYIQCGEEKGMPMCFVCCFSVLQGRAKATRRRKGGNGKAS